MSDNHQYLARAILASIKAGKAILEVYHTDFSVAHKADNSPLTLADRKSHQIIKESLMDSGIPILSEEGRQIPLQERLSWERLWIVDPLDGTKEFVKCKEDFTVNIALIEKNKPVLGVIYVPIKKTLYFAAQALGSYKLEVDQLHDLLNDGSSDESDEGFLNEIIALSNELPLGILSDSPFIIVGSRSHGGPKLEAFVEDKRKEYNRVEFIAAGSSLKFCYVAEGRAHIYPRFGPTSEWDTAAGQAIVENAGGEVVDYNTGRPLVYNKEDILNPWFIVKRKN